MTKTIVIIGLTCITIACTKHEPAQPKTRVDAKRGVQFEYPADWTTEELAEQNVLLLSSPVQEANWQTNVFIELRSDLDASQTPEQRLSTLADNLKRTKTGFALQSSRVFAPGKALFVNGSAVTSLWSKYEPQMNVVFDSMRRAS